MYLVAVLINIVFITSGKCQGTGQPTSTGPERVLESTTPTERSCRIPPYPDNGGYVVINEPSARPGDRLRNLTLIQYSVDGSDRLMEVNVFACSFGEWYLKVMRYEVGYDRFDASSCPLLCANSSDVRSSVQKNKPSKTPQVEIQPSNLCKMPPYPENGWYEVANRPQTKPGATLAAAYLLYRCNLRYKIQGNREVVCFDGTWYEAAPKCIEEHTAGTSENSTLYKTRCELPPYPENGKYFVLNMPRANPGETYETVNMEYSCNSDSQIVGSKRVYCFNGVWSSEFPRCVRCGFITNTGAVNASASVLPWHVGIYDKSISPYRQICSGSVIATNLVLSAASCFRTVMDEVLPASRFAVAVGKLYRGWDDARDTFAQKTDVNRIAVPSRFRGALTNFQNDIAVLFLSEPLKYTDYVAPICLDLSTESDEMQLKANNTGKFGVWDSAGGDAEESSALQIKELAYVDVVKCITDASPEFRSYITSDKICAAVSDGTELCESHRGGGLFFSSADDKGTTLRHYLRGIGSAVSKEGETCIKRPLRTFTQITSHEPFLKANFETAIW